MIRWLLAPLAIIFRRQPMPPMPYALGEDHMLIDGVVDPEFVFTHKYTNERIALVGCHYSSKFGEYVYWCKPLTRLNELPVAIPESYIE